MPKSLMDIAYEYVEASNEPVPFSALWAHVCEESGLSQEAAQRKVGQFYTNLTLDGRLVVLKNNLVDLKSRHASEEYVIDMKDAYTEAEIEDTGDDAEAEQEEASLSGVEKNDENSDYESEEEGEDKENYR